MEGTAKSVEEIAKSKGAHATPMLTLQEKGKLTAETRIRLLQGVFPPIDR
jgi:hypothetical protein